MRAVSGSERRTAEGIAAEEFEGIVRQHQQRIYRMLLAMLRDQDAADTLTQETFLRAYEKRESFRGEAAIGTWLVRIALNLARDHIRSRRVGFWRKLFSGQTREEDQQAVAETVADNRATPERELLAREEVRAVWSAVEALPAQQRAVFILRFSEEMPLEEIADSLDIHLGTVKSHLSRAVATVRKNMKERAGVRA